MPSPDVIDRLVREADPLVHEPAALSADVCDAIVAAPVARRRASRRLAFAVAGAAAVAAAVGATAVVLPEGRDSFVDRAYAATQVEGRVLHLVRTSRDAADPSTLKDGLRYESWSTPDGQRWRDVGHGSDGRASSVVVGDRREGKLRAWKVDGDPSHGTLYADDPIIEYGALGFDLQNPAAYIADVLGAARAAEPGTSVVDNPDGTTTVTARRPAELRNIVVFDRETLLPRRIETVGPSPMGDGEELVGSQTYTTAEYLDDAESALAPPRTDRVDLVNQPQG